MRGQEFGTPFVETATGTARTTATHSASAGKTFYVTDVSVSANGGGVTFAVQQGTTTLWQGILSTGTSNAVYAQSFRTPLAGASGAAVSVTVGTAASVSYANISGYEL